jgi:hypothetical protein
MDPIALATAIVGLISAYFGARGARAQYRTVAAEAEVPKSDKTDMRLLENFMDQLHAHPPVLGALETLRLDPQHHDAAAHLTAELGRLFWTDTTLADLAQATYQALTQRNGPIFVTDSGAVALESIKMRGRYVAGRDLQINPPAE